MSNLPFVEEILADLRRCKECFDDFESGGVGIGRKRLDLLTKLGLLERVQRSPAQWMMTQAGEDAIAPPAAAHGASEFFVDFDTLRKALSIYGLAAPVSNEELGLQMDRQAVRVIEAVAKMPFPTSAAAHGDEAVRKILEAFPLLGDAGLDHETHHCEWSIQQERKRLHKLLNAMRAQGDGGGE